MQLIENLDHIEQPFKNAVLTTGNFDGVHNGHQSLCQQVIQKARKINGQSIVMIFDPHPRQTLGKPIPPLITKRDQKIELIEKTGIDILICVPFDRTFADIPADIFVKKILVEKFGIKAIITGADYKFGRNGTGDITLLQELGEQCGFETIIADWIRDIDDGNERISSTRIRNIVSNGQVDQAMKYLGRYYQIRGKVIKGRERGGSQLGFPTANIKLHDELCPKPGVYAVLVETSLGNYKGVANIGFSPTFGDHQFTIEVHILDFDSDIYHTRIRVNMVKRLRSEIKFDSIEQLASQIQKDIETAKDILRKNDHP